MTIKAASGDLIDRWLLALLTPEAAVITILSLVGLVVSARSLQLGPAVAVIAITSAAANVVTIAAGPIVFSEPLPDGTLSLVARLVGFTAVIVGAILTPGAGGRGGTAARRGPRTGAGLTAPSWTRTPASSSRPGRLGRP